MNSRYATAIHQIAAAPIPQTFMPYFMLLHVLHYELRKSYPHNWDTKFKV